MSRTRLIDDCPTSSLIWSASRIICGVHWDWDAQGRFYKTYTVTRDAFFADIREWPAATPLSSLLRALREDDRLADPVLRLMGLYVAIEYVTSLWIERR